MQHFQYCMHWCCQTTPLRYQKETMQAFYRPSGGSKGRTSKLYNYFVGREEAFHIYIHILVATKDEVVEQDEPSVNVRSAPIKQVWFSKSFSCIHLHRNTGLPHIYFLRKNTWIKHMPFSSLIPFQNSLPTETTSFT